MSIFKGGAINLTAEQAAALQHLVEGRGVGGAAEAIGRHRSTVSRWLNKDPSFMAAYNEVVCQQLEEVRLDVQTSVVEALRVVRSNIVDGSLTAARLLLDFVPKETRLRLFDPDPPRDATEIVVRQHFDRWHRRRLVEVLGEDLEETLDFQREEAGLDTPMTERNRVYEEILDLLDSTESPVNLQGIEQGNEQALVDSVLGLQKGYNMTFQEFQLAPARHFDPKCLVRRFALLDRGRGFVRVLPPSDMDYGGLRDWLLGLLEGTHLLIQVLRCSRNATAEAQDQLRKSERLLTELQEGDEGHEGKVSLDYLHDVVATAKDTIIWVASYEVQLPPKPRKSLRQ